jgi:phage tail-like protein
MRGAIDGLVTADPIVEMMPAVYQEDEFTGRFTAGLDDVVAPILSVLDCLDAYVDPLLAPADFLEWLATWVGIPLHQDIPLERRRILVANAVRLHRMRGTVTGLRIQVELLTGGQVELADNGGVSWSDTPGGPLPGEDTPRLAVRVRHPDPDAVPLDVLDDVVNWAKPAHVVHRVEVVGQ